MKLYYKTIFTVLFLCACFGANQVQAQDLQQALSNLNAQVVGGYIDPILGNWANDLNSGIYHTAALHSVLGFDLSVNLALAHVSDGDKTFQFTMPIPVNANGVLYPANTPITASTAVGPKNSTVLTTVNGLPIMTIPPGYDLPYVPLPMPQVSLGLPFGIEVMARYIPTVSAGSEGKFNSSGFGARYSIDQWIPMCPVNIAVHFMTQKLNFKSKSDTSIFSGKGTAYGLEVSKKLAILTLYAGFQLESSSMTVDNYEYTNQATGLSSTIQGFTVNGSNKSRFTVGANFSLLIFDIQADYSFASTPVATLGAGFSFR
jgi:hypothetical protein